VNATELKSVVENHGKWLRDEVGGSRAYLRGADLRGADLSRAYLRGAYLRWAYLRGADLRGADLSRADLSWADLSGADLSRADLRGADLRGADLSGADLSGADLSGADLSGAYLRGADLSGADLRGADLRRAYLRGADLSGATTDDKTRWPHFQLPQGELVAWKRVGGKIVQLRIPAEAKRTASLVGRKCRAEYAVVVDIEGGEPVSTRGLRYSEGETVRPDIYDDDPKVECTHGIHFFATRAEAEEF
jgi:hypothetical protein